MLGPLEVLVHAAPVVIRGRHHPKILALLLADAGKAIPLQRLIDALWDDEPPDTAYQQVQNIVGALRRQLGPDGNRLRTVGNGYRLEVATEELDLLRCRTAAARSRALREAGRPDEALAALQSGLAEWRGPALAGMAGRMVEAAARRLDEYHLSLVEERIDLQLELGGHGDLIGELRQLVAEHPLRQRLTAQLMLVLHRSGRTPEALQTFTDVSTQLANDLGIDPGQPLRDLHTAILREDPDLMAPPERPVVPHVDPRPAAPALLPADITAFTGRTEHLDTLDALLGFDASRTRLAVLSGHGGIGKTTLALHWAHRVADRFPDGQLYVNLRGFDPNGSPMAPDEAVRPFLDALGVPHGRVPSDPEARIGLYRSLLADRRALVVLDNAADAAQVRSLLPSGPDCFTLVTSRDRLSGLVAAQCAHPIAMQLLDTREAVQLLERRIGKQRMTDEPDAVTQIIDSCKGLPLALAITAARAATHPNFSLDAAAVQLRDSRSRLDALSGDDPATDVRSVFSWSYRLLSDEASRTFRLLALHPGPDITAPAVASLAGIPPQRTGVLLRELTRTHLLAEHEPGRYCSHDLLRSYATELTTTVDSETDRNAAIGRMLDHYLHTAASGSKLISPNRIQFDLADLHPGAVPEALADEPQAMRWFVAEHRVLVGSVDVGFDAWFDIQTWQLGATMAEFLFRRVARHESIAVLDTALSAAQRQGSIPGQIEIHRFLSIIAIDGWDLEKARGHLEEALGLAELEGDPLLLGQVTVSLSRVFGREERREEAIELLRIGIGHFESAGHVPGISAALGSLGWQYAQLGAYEEALACCRKSLSTRKKSGYQIGAASVWDTIGFIHHRRGDLPEALECYRTVVRLASDAGHQAVEADALNRSGDVLESIGDFSAARRSWSQALRIYDGLHHPVGAKVREKLDRLTG